MTEVMNPEDQVATELVHSQPMLVDGQLEAGKDEKADLVKRIVTVNEISVDDEEDAQKSPPEVAVIELSSIHQSAWTAGNEGHDSTGVHGATIDSPRIAFQPPLRLLGAIRPRDTTKDALSETENTAHNGSHLPPKGLILSGTIVPFGLESLTAEFYSHHGPLPPWIDQKDDRSPVYQIAMMREDLRISSILPSFSGTNFDVIALQNVNFTYQARNEC